jgi:addiction module HigA family antidote
MAALTTPHERALTILFTELESAASEPAEAFLGTPGTLTERINEWGTKFCVTVPTVNEIVRRRRAVTAEMALCLSRYFGTTAQLWQNLQSQYDWEIACQRIGKKVQSGIQPLARPDITGQGAVS